MALVDLNELSRRESERVEWKENIADIEDIIKTAVAFANDYSNLGGGYIICGAREIKDEYGFQKLEKMGLTSTRLKEIEGKVLCDLREKVSPAIIPVTDEIPVDNQKRILVFIIPGSKEAHSYRSRGKGSSTYYVRIGRETREARNSILRELLLLKNKREPWDKCINIQAEIEDIDLIVLREYLKEMKVWDPNRAIETYLSETNRISSFVPALAGKVQLTNTLKPKNFTLLLFSKDPLKFFSGAFTVFSIYRGKDRSESTAERHEITGNIVEQARKCIELLNAESYTFFDKTDSVPNQLKYPSRALQEAVINCFAHRDYEIGQPVRITIFIDRVEIYSPGSLPRAIDREKFLAGKATPYWRNQTLAYFFNKLQLAQSEGQGIPTIIRTMREEGCPAPIFQIESESLTCILPAHPRHAVLKELSTIENEIIFGKHKEAGQKLTGILQNDPYNYRAVDLYCEVNRLLNTPENIVTYLDIYNIKIENIPANTLITIAETLSLIKGSTGYDSILSGLFKYAGTIALEEKHIEKMVISMKKVNQNEELIAFVDKKMQMNKSLTNNIILLENRARAKIDLAKKCIDTGRNWKEYRNPKIRAKAWENARKYLDEAERDLQHAMECAASSVDIEYIKKDLSFLAKMKNSAKKPGKKI
ncbi:MAG: putative DNA binding domain-containing protein [Spirochaetales bacterium]|nr:putative DNA binding domain-containing protein [Spirochaetales bacterium]